MKSLRLRAAIVSLLLWVICAPFLARFLVVQHSLEQPDVLLVLSGSSVYRARTQTAASIFLTGRGKRIVITNDYQRGGWSQKDERNPFFYERELDELARAGVPREDIDLLAEPVNSTYQEAVALRRYIAKYPVKSVLIVTSPYHSRRAYWTFRRMLSDTDTQVGIESVPLGVDSPTPAIWWLTPHGWSVVAGEYMKLSYYWLRY
ncbi:MAG: YdcF family protein [Pyrinomonadaceae bacterium]